jgi:hypothetical protein
LAPKLQALFMRAEPRRLGHQISQALPTPKSWPLARSSVCHGKVFEIAGQLPHQLMNLGPVNRDVLGGKLAGLAYVDSHELSAIQPFQPVGAFTQQSCDGRERDD